MNALEVRPATTVDVAEIRRIGVETWPAAYAFAGKEFIERGLDVWWSEEAVLRGIETTRTFVAVAGTQVVGMGNVDLRPEIPVIWKLYVLPGFHGSGVGKALLARLLKEVPSGSDVTLEYIDGNMRAASFYERNGFTELRREEAGEEGWPARVWMIRSSPENTDPA